MAAGLPDALRLQFETSAGSSQGDLALATLTGAVGRLDRFINVPQIPA